MKIVHTADVHLSSDHPERLDALEEVLDVCREEEAKLLLITGDLFNANVDIDDLKTDVRALFEDNEFQTLVIPGNHDKSFRNKDYFGKDIEVLTSKPYEQRTFDDINIVALPYTDKSFAELVETLSGAKEEGKTNILMLHCTLTGSSGTFGEESEYLPVEPSELVKTGFDYVLAGHIHSSATRKSFSDTKFAYSGSPVSISSSETGKRKVWVLDTEEGMKTKGLNTFHYLREDGTVLPGEEEEKRDEIVENLKKENLNNASVIAEFGGFTEESVPEFSDQLEEEIVDLGVEEVEVDTSNLKSKASVVGSEIYIEFKERLTEKDFENPEKVEEKLLEGLSRYDR